MPYDGYGGDEGFPHDGKQGRYRCIAGLWSSSYGTWQSCICNPPVWQVVHRRKHRPDAYGEAP